MRALVTNLERRLGRIDPQYLPFADIAASNVSLTRLWRLSLFQVSAGMIIVLLTGTLNRIMVVELGTSASVVAVMLAIPLVVAPFRAYIGYQSDRHRSALGWRRIPYLWFGSLLQFGGLAIMPFALFILAGDTHGPLWVGPASAALAFLMVGVGLHTTQTVGLALANDMATPETRPRVVALLYVMLLSGMIISAMVFGWMLRDFSHVRTIQLVQGIAVVTLILNSIALWKQEARNPALTQSQQSKGTFRRAWRDYIERENTRRFLCALGLGTAGFSMQDVLLEPYGGEVLGMSVSSTTALTAILAAGTLIGFLFAGRSLARGKDACRIAGLGIVAGLFAFASIALSAPFDSTLLFRLGTGGIGFGAGIFAVGTLSAAMSVARSNQTFDAGLALGAWGAVQATAAGLGIAVGAVLRDVSMMLANTGMLGEVLANPATGYMAVYHAEIIILFITLIIIGPLVRPARRDVDHNNARIGVANFPG